MRWLTQYYGAMRTGRWCLPAETPVLVRDRDGVREVPITEVTRAAQVWDGAGWVAHEGVVFSGYHPVISHDGVVATTEHRVSVSDTESMTLAEAKATDRRLWRGTRTVSTDFPEWEILHTEGSQERGSQGREVPTYDIVNAGPRNRFMAWGRIVANSGRGPQVQNYPRSEVYDQEGLVDYILGDGDPEGMEIFFGVDCLTGLASALRGCLTVLKGSVFAAVDFSQIEARVLPWLAGDRDLLDVFLSGRDIYRVAAARIFGVPEASVTGDQRSIGKVSILALGYQGGAGAFQSMAKNYGLVLPEAEADPIKSDWREGNPLIVRLWYAVEGAALKAVKHPGQSFFAGKCEFRMRGRHLIVKLPSNRELVYREVQLDTGTFGNEAVSYMGVDQYTRAWVRIITYGGKLVENITQAVARDVMASGMLRLCRAGYTVLGSVHDELLLELDPAKGETLGKVLTLFRENPKWALDLPIDAGGYEGARFRKG